MTKVTKGLAATALAAAIAAAWWMGRTPEQKVTAQLGEAASGAAPAQTKGAVSVTADARPGSPQINLPRTTTGSTVQTTFGKSLEDLVNSSGTLASAYRALENTGSVDAKYFSANIVAHCAGYRPQIAQIHERKIASEPDTPVKAMRLAELKKRIASCAELATADPDAAMAAAAKAGSGKALAYTLGFKTPETRAENDAMTRQAEALASLNDPYIISELAGFFSVRDRAMVWRLPGIDGDIEGNELRGALRLVACDLGKDCSATSVDSIGSCIVIGGSSCNTDLETRIRDAEFSPAAFARVQQIRHALTQAARNGRLPGELWQGVVRGAGTRRPSQ